MSIEDVAHDTPEKIIRQFVHPLLGLQGYEIRKLAAALGLEGDLAKQFGVPLYPFFLDGVAADPALNQPDRMHPNAEGVRIIVERMLPAVVAALGPEG